MTDRPFLAITMGDAAGIGPEVTAKTLIDRSIYERCRPFVVGNTDAMNDALRFIGSEISARAADTLEEIDGEHGIIDVLDLGNLNFNELEYGKILLDSFS